MVQSLQASNPSRIFFALPELLDSQRDSFNDFLKQGIAKEFSKLSPIRVESKNIIAELVLDGENYQLVSPNDNPRDCILKMKTYDCKIYIKGQIVYKTFAGTILHRTRSEWLLVGHLPLMTKRGHFIINGSPRVIVQQVVRCPGIYFQETADKDPNKKSRFYADIIPKRGVWLRVQITKKGEIQIKFKKGKRIQAEILQKCLQVIERQERLKSLVSAYKSLSQLVSHPTPFSALGMGTELSSASVLAKDLINACLNKQSYLNEICIIQKRKQAELGREYLNFAYAYEKLYRPTEDKEREQIAIKTDNDASDSSFKAQKCYTNLFSTFKIESRYDLSELGRQKINTKFGVTVSETQLTALDLQITRYWLHKYSKGEKRVDDIDHSKNRRIRTSASLLQSQFEIGIERLKKFTWNKLKEFINTQLTEFESLEIPTSISSSFHTPPFRDTFLTPRDSLERVRRTKNLNNAESVTKDSFIFSKDKANQNIARSLLKATSQSKANTLFLPLTIYQKSLPILKNNANELKLDYRIDLSEHRSSSHRRWYSKDSFYFAKGEKIKAFKPLKTQISVLPIQTTEVKTPTLFENIYLFPISYGCLLQVKGIDSKTENFGFLNSIVLQGRTIAKQKLTNSTFNFYRKIQLLLRQKKNINLKNVVSAKPLTGAFREFFGSNPLSQYMDQTNPLAELTHKRRISSLGIGGVSRDSAGMAIRGIHATHYGRICPIETPEGKNAGLVNSLSFFAKVDSNGFVKTPYYKLFKGQIQNELGFAFFSAEQETVHNFSIAPNDLQKSCNNILQNNSVAVRIADNILDLFKKIHPYSVDCIGISPIQMISVATSLIPFLEHNDANRALMGSNMQRQAVPLMIPERPLVGTGLEAIVLAESGHITQSKVTGFISYVSCNEIVVESLQSLKGKNSGGVANSKVIDVIPRVKEKVLKQSKPIRVKRKSGVESRRFLPQLRFGKVHKNTLLSYRALNRIFVSIKFQQIKLNSDKQSFAKLAAEIPAPSSFFLPFAEQKVSLGAKGGGFALPFFAFPIPLEGDGDGYQLGWSDKGDAYGYLRRGTEKEVKSSFNTFCFPRNEKEYIPLTSKKKKKQKTPKLLKSELTSCTHVIQNFNRSNQDICLVERALVQEGDWVQQGDILTDCSASEKGELAVGKNVLLAYLPWEGYNFEDAIVISDRLVKENIYTSLHIERYDFDAQDFREGNEWFTNDLPGIASKNVKHLNEFGLPKIGSFVKEGDILVGKIKYSNKKATTPYERLLCDILGEKNFAARDASLYLPRGVEARVIHHQLLGFDTFDFANEGSSTPSRNVVKGFAKPPNLFAVGKEGGSHTTNSSLFFSRKATISSVKGQSTRFSLPERSREVLDQIDQTLFTSSESFDKNFKVESKEQSLADTTSTRDSLLQTTPHYFFYPTYHKEKEEERGHKSLFAFTDTLYEGHKTTLNSTEFAKHISDGAKETPAKLTSKNRFPKVVNIFLGEKRPIQVGDKMSGRHGNKGVVSTILPRQDMPYLADGRAIDILLNPLGVPSRMNVGQVFECLLGLAATYLAQHFKITPFDESYGIEASQSLVYLKLYQARLQSGQNWLFQVDFPGKTRLIDGRSGETFDQWVTVGRAYMLKLIHMVNEKIHARSTGPYALITQQPLRGRSQKGGQRLGEMEVWALQGFGAASILQELLTKKSDDSIGRKEIAASILPRPVSILETVLLSDNFADKNKVVKDRLAFVPPEGVNQVVGKGFAFPAKGEEEVVKTPSRKGQVALSFPEGEVDKTLRETQNPSLDEFTEKASLTPLAMDISYGTFRMEKEIASKENQKSYSKQNKVSLGQPEIFKVLVCELQALCLDIGLYTLTKQSFQKSFMTTLY